MENFIEDAKNYADLVSEKVKSVKIEDVNGLEQCQEILAYNKAISKEIQEKKEAITKPLNASLKEVRALFKPIEDKLDETEKLVKSAMLDFKKKLDEERRAEIKTMEDEPSQELIEKVATMNTIRTRKVKRLSILDESLIPDDYWKVDEDKLFKALQMGVKVAGCELIEVESVINNY